MQLVKDWESAFFGTATPRTRKIALRTSLVFSPAPGSVFAALSRLVRAGLGGTQGNGRQFVSWMHESDYARALEFLIDHEEIEGPVNLAAPNPLPNREFMAALREAWDMPNGLPAPARAAEAWHVLSAHRAGAGSQEPPRRSRPSARRRLPVRISHLARSRRRSGAAVARSDRDSMTVSAPG